MGYEVTIQYCNDLCSFSMLYNAQVGSGHIFCAKSGHNFTHITAELSWYVWNCHYNDVIMSIISKNFPRCWSFVREIHRLPVNSPHKGQWRGALIFFYLPLNKRLSKQSWGWDLRRHLAHYDVIELEESKHSYLNTCQLEKFRRQAIIVTLAVSWSIHSKAKRKMYHLIYL